MALRMNKSKPHHARNNFRSFCCEQVQEVGKTNVDKHKVPRAYANIKQLLDQGQGNWYHLSDNSYRLSSMSYVTVLFT